LWSGEFGIIASPSVASLDGDGIHLSVSIERHGAGARMHCSRSVQSSNSKSIQKPSGERVAGWFAKEWLKVNEALARGIASSRHKPRSRFLCLRFARPQNDHN
jgi:hypothetical protein